MATRAFVSCAFSIIILTAKVSLALRVPPYQLNEHPVMQVAPTTMPSSDFEFPSYKLSDHPMIQLAPSMEPVIMDRYYRFSKHGASPMGMLFTPGKASYNSYDTKTPFLVGLDVMFIQAGKGKHLKHTDTFVEVHLRKPSKVFLLLSGSGFHKMDIMNNPVVKGLKGLYGFSKPRSLVTPTRKNVKVSDRFGFARLSGSVVAIEGTTQRVLKLPHPRFATVNGKRVRSYHIAFAQIGDDAISPHSYPQPPPSVPNYFKGGYVFTADFPVVPNQRCPEWLHDLYVVKTRESALVTSLLNDNTYWRTWHPQIDPVFWCYYDHEHGAYPGRFRPAFDYTAWKTFDKDGSFEQRQDESHEGFKVFSFPLPKYRKYVVIVIHMHLAFARRFSARFHTASFAVLNENWEIEMNLQMKMDFGAARATLKNKKNICIGQSQCDIVREMENKKVKAFRRFNILNIDKKTFPKSVDTRFRLSWNVKPKKGNQRKLKQGIYEQWAGPINTCSISSGNFNKGFTIDVRDPSTAIRFFEIEATDSTKQLLRGAAVNRVMDVLDEITVAKEHCHFDIFSSETVVNLEDSAGVFYTDSKFRKIKDGPGKYHVRQYIHPDFSGIKIQGKLRPVDPWNAHMEYKTSKKMNTVRRFYNIERGVNKGRN